MVVGQTQFLSLAAGKKWVLDQRKETIRSNHCRKIQHLPFRRLQRTGYLPSKKSLHGERGNGEDHK
jgi:hypothetical protein